MNNIMEIGNQQNQSYWFVVREDQTNVIFSATNCTIQNSQIAEEEARYIAGTGEDRQYIQVDNVHPPTAIEAVVQTCDPKSNETKINDSFWDRNKIKRFLSLCLDKRCKSSNNDKIMWEEIATLMHTTPDECDKKYKSLKRTYIRLFRKKKMGRNIKWVHYSACEELFNDCKAFISAIIEPWEDVKLRRLLNLYIENISKFHNTSTNRQKDIWADIALQLNTSDHNCYHKFKNLKRMYFKWIDSHQDPGKLAKWPYYHYFERIFHNYSPNSKSWDKNKIGSLISTYRAIAHKFRNPKYQKKELWKEISQTVGESAKACDRKFRNLKQTYNRLKKRLGPEKSLSKWRYYRDFEILFEHGTYTISEGGQERTIVQDYVDQLLAFCVKNKSKFKDPLVRKRSLWKQIGPKMGLTPDECDKKFRNLKQTYIRLSEKKRETGKTIHWPYFSYFEQIYDNKTILKEPHKCTVDNLSLLDVRNLINNIQINDSDKFERLVKVMEDSNNIQRERNELLLSLLNRRL